MGTVGTIGSTIVGKAGTRKYGCVHDARRGMVLVVKSVVRLWEVHLSFWQSSFLPGCDERGRGRGPTIWLRKVVPKKYAKQAVNPPARSR